MDQFIHLPSKVIDVLASFILSIGFFSSPVPVAPPTITTMHPSHPVVQTATTSIIVAPVQSRSVSGLSTSSSASASTHTRTEIIKNESAATSTVVIAQVYESDPGSPLFATLILPKLQDNQKDYQIYLWNGDSYEFYQNLAPLVQMTFPSGGVSRFKIGIDPELNLQCNGFFLKQVTFSSSGGFKGTSSRLTNDPEHPVCQ